VRCSRRSRSSTASSIRSRIRSACSTSGSGLPPRGRTPLYERPIGGVEGLALRYADYEYWLRGRRANTAYRSIVLFDLPIGAPSTSIRRENILTRAADAAGVEDIDFESEEFNREYRVSSDDPSFARAIVDARMMRWLLDEAKHSVFELSGSTVLAYYLLFTDPRDLDWFLERAVGFRDHIPRMV